MSAPQPPDGPAINGAMLTIGDATFVRHGGLWVPLLIPQLDFDALVDAAFDSDVEDDMPTGDAFIERYYTRALVSPQVVDDEANRWMGAR